MDEPNVAALTREPSPVADDAAPSTPPPNGAAGPTAPPVARARTDRRITVLVDVVVLVVAVVFVWLQLHPGLLLTDNTPSGGDMGAHVWGPAFLRDHLLPHFRLTGWTTDWYAGFPAYQYYMVVPALAVVALDVIVPYGIAFKLVTVAGLLAMPVAAYALGRLFRVRFPGPALLALATIPFLFDTSFTIYGGNIASTLAGEFAFTISLALLVVYLGFLARGLETGRHRVVTAVLFGLVALCHPIPLLGLATVGTLSIVIWHVGRALRVERRWAAVRSTLWYALSTVAVGALLSAFWIVPFLGRHTYFNDMGWERLPTSRDKVLFYLLHAGSETRQLSGFDRLSTVPVLWLAVMILAAVGVVMSWVRREQLGCVLSLTGVGLVLMFCLLPQGWLWNARLLPFWYLTVYLLAAVGLAQLVRPLANVPARGAVAFGTLAVVLFAVGLPLGVVWGSTRTTTGRWSFLGMETKESFVKSWAKWNYSGYEGKAAYPEYYAVITKMQDIGKQDGCGRALWEYDNDRLNSYGTPMSLMLLPYWTDGCIGSMEGLYFEASSTTPYHFLMQSELSARPSRPQRKLPYSGLDMQRGVQHLQLMGVRYYMAFSQQAVAAARANPELVEIGQVGGDAARVNQLRAAAQPDQAAIDRASPWVIFQVKDAPLVQGLRYQPVVVTDVDQRQSSWLQPSAAYFDDPSRWDPFPAASGPSAWPRAALSSGDTLPHTPVDQPAVVSDVKTTQSTVSFTVDRQSLGKPVLVKTSYFPNWHVKGGVGPYRVMPNFMVVVPTSTKVTLSYGYTPVDEIGWALTLVGLFGLVVFFRRPALAVARREGGPAAEPPAGVTDRHDWLAGERDATVGWVWAAPEDVLGAGPPGGHPPEPGTPGEVAHPSNGEPAAHAPGTGTGGERALVTGPANNGHGGSAPAPAVAGGAGSPRRGAEEEERATDTGAGDASATGAAGTGVPTATGAPAGEPASGGPVTAPPPSPAPPPPGASAQPPPGWGTLADGTPIDAAGWARSPSPDRPPGPPGQDVQWTDRDVVDDLDQ